MKWIKSLKIEDGDSVERRLETLLSYFSKKYQNNNVTILDIDASGKLGGDLVRRFNVEKEVSVSLTIVINMTKEDGQIFELDLRFDFDGQIQILIRDGQHFDVLGNDNEIPSEIVGPHFDQNFDLFIKK
jgi:hypothetical protein